MSIDRTERLLNLVLCLLSTHQPVPRETIRRIVAGYDPDGSDAAFERMFERDKEDLRALGIPILTVTTPDGEVLGYRIPEEEYRLASVQFTPAQWALLGVAARAWSQANLASAAHSAVRKFEALIPAEGGEIPDIARLVTWQQGPRPGTHMLPRIWQAIREHRRLRFTYRGRRDDSGRPRVVEPWSIVGRDGGWYLIGRDPSIEVPDSSTRVFRTSRILGEVEFASDRDTFEVPDHDPDDLVTPEPSDMLEAWVEIDPGHGARLRSQAGTRTTQAPPGRVDPDRDLIGVVTGDRDALLNDISALGHHVRVLSPDDLAEDVRARWRRILALHSDDKVASEERGH